MIKPRRNFALSILGIHSVAMLLSPRCRAVAGCAGGFAEASAAIFRFPAASASGSPAQRSVRAGRVKSKFCYETRQLLSLILFSFLWA